MFEFKAFNRFLMCVILIRPFGEAIEEAAGTLRTLIQTRPPFVGTMWISCWLTLIDHKYFEYLSENF